MCITKSVGHTGQNDYVDVKMIQVLLNLNLYRFTNSAPAKLKPDGQIGPKTIRVIRRFETEVMALESSDEIIVSGDTTIKALVAGLQPGLSPEKLTAMMPYALPKNTKRYSQPLLDAMPNYDINTPLRMAHFLAQIGHESGSLRYSEELASGEAYEGRRDLGNTEPGDGKRFKGRGLIQLTGRSNYQAYSNDRGIDYIANPRRLSTDANAAVDVACWYWQTRQLNTYADQDDVKKVTKIINGGTNGLDDRIAFLARTKCLLGV